MRLAGSRGGNEPLVAGTEPAKSCRDARHLRHLQSRGAHWLVLNWDASPQSRGAHWLVLNSDASPQSRGAHWLVLNPQRLPSTDAGWCRSR